METNGRFFTNDRIVIGSNTNERYIYPANSRPETQKVFKTPEHTIGSKNLLVYVNGELVIPERDYKDINSSQISFTDPIPPNKDVDIVLVLTGDDLDYRGNYWVDF